MQQLASEGSWASYGSSGASSSQQPHQNGFTNDMHKVQHMPDVISDVQTMNLNRVDDFMDGEHDHDPMLSHHINNNQTSNLLNLDHLTNDPMLSASSSNNHIHQQQLSTVDMSSIDPIVTNYGLMSMHHHSNCDNASVESILQSDSDSLISDIDMIAWRIVGQIYDDSFKNSSVVQISFFVSIVRI